MSAEKKRSVIAELDVLIVQATDPHRSEGERARLALEVCERIRTENVKLVSAFEWVDAHRKWKLMQAAGRVMG